MNTPRPVNRPSRLNAAVIAALLALATSACGSAPAAPEAKPMPSSTSSGKNSSQALWQQIQAEIGDAACDGPQQCHSVAVGAKACGGPDAYLAWSSKRSNEAKLRALVAAHAQARKDENATSGMVSDCRMVTDPGASCQAGRCVLQPPGAVPAPKSAE
ncbi:MAG: hypothetical protein K2W93_18225 [Burkholderiaceae bacterium]|nr:hypothetical protein [Burkholderiaceae bacterium]